MKILMVCLGNICRSPLAEGILRQKTKEKNLNWTIDSAGTGSWHIGESPDNRSIKVGKKYGIDISKQKARQFQSGKIKNSVAASDAFFPFADGIQTLIKAGIKIIVQPGGSIRDQEIINIANKAKIKMLFTGVRHFNH